MKKIIKISAVVLLSITICLGVFVGPYLPAPKRWVALFANNNIKEINPSSSRPNLAIIIPVFNETKERMYQALTYLEVASRDPGLLEVIVVDGGSTDDTMACCENSDWSAFGSFKTVKATGGRGPSINKGIELSEAPLLMFLHADCKLEYGYDDFIASAFRDNNIIMTAFEFSIGSDEYLGIDSNIYRNFDWLERRVNFRSKNFWFPYGDQALAIRRKDLDSILGGKIPNYKMMEDIELVVRVRDYALDNNKQIAILPIKVKSSPRRWFANGIVKNSAMNWFFVAAYVWGNVSPDQIFEWYYG